MAKKIILGSDFGRDAFKAKVNDNFTELYDKDVALGESINSFVDGTKLVGKAKYLQTNDMGATDPNALIESGLYLTNHANNPSNDLYYINVIKHPAESGYIAQVAKYAFGTETYTRREIGGSWTAWEKIITNKQINWITATLQNGATGFIYYRKNQIGRIDVYGSITLGTVASNTVIATLPIEYRPSDYEIINFLNISTSLPQNNIGITANGGIYLMNITGLSTGNAIEFRKSFFVG